MEKIITDVMVAIGLLLGSGWSAKALHNEVRKELVTALMKPTSSLSKFTMKLTRPN